MSFRFGEEVSSVESAGRGTITTLASGKKIAAEVVMHSAGRQGNTTALNLDLAGLHADKRGRLVVNQLYQTEMPHIYAVGDVIGFPSAAATSMDQGTRRGERLRGAGERTQAFQPIGIYTIPEISFCGKTEEELTREAIRGRHFSAIPGAGTRPDHRRFIRMLKLIVHADNREILGVHVFGTNATELVHIGQAIMGCGGTVDYLVDTVLNYPTLPRPTRLRHSMCPTSCELWRG